MIIYYNVTGVLSMIISYGDLFWSEGCPPEDDAPLFVYANRMKTRKSTFEDFETVTWRCRKVPQFTSLIQLNQFS